MTPKERIVNKLMPKYEAGIDWAGIVAAVQSATQDEKDGIVHALKERNTPMAGKKLGRLVLAYLKTQAETEADSIIADGSITLEEFERIYG